MRLGDQIEQDWNAAYAALTWQIDCGVDDFILDEPLDRFALPEARAVEVRAPAAPERPASAPPGAPRPAAYAPPPERPKIDPVVEATQAAARAKTLEALRAEIEAFSHCELKQGARTTVFADGNPKARVLILGEAPGRDEDQEGRPFVGRAGQLLDLMFAAIGLSRTSVDAETAFYITNVLPWRPPGNRDPEPGEIAMMRPFVERHIELVAPDVIVAMGNTPLFALTGTRGIMRARGTWAEALGRPLLPMTHPAYLLRNPIAKREAWDDLLTLRDRLRGA